ncbi:MAG: diacylglycerol kinase family protein, partial [Halanaerobium sp.]
MNKKIMVIVNPEAAGAKVKKIWPEKSLAFKKKFGDFDEVYTKKAGDAVEIARKAVAKNYDYIMSVGGDGTINEIVNGMLFLDNKKPETKLIIYPLGTGSDLSRALNLPRVPEKIIDLIRRDNSKEIKIVKASYCNHQQQREKRYFLNIADCGMGAEVAKKLNESKKTIDGSLSYLLKIFQTLFAYQNIEMKIEADNKLLY